MKQANRPSKNIFLKYRAPSRGNSNPQEMTNPFWVWAISQGVSAYELNQAFEGPDSHIAGPCWCFDRFGQAEVTLQDGTRAFIGGEHEDHYDPDFYIYNDVILIKDGVVSILGYPEKEFPPTDFHSATLVDESIFLIGNLGYPRDRQADQAQVMCLNTNDWSISRVATTGETPGWIHDHQVEYLRDEHAIVIRGGKRVGDRITENIDDYRLCLKSMVWFKLTVRNWGRWLLEREDGSANDLWHIRHASMHEQMGVEFQEELASVLADTGIDGIEGTLPKADPEQVEAIKSLYCSPFTGDIAEVDDENYARYRLKIEGITVRFDEDTYGITVTIEGELPRSVEGELLNELSKKLSQIDRSPYKIVPIGS